MFRSKLLLRFAQTVANNQLRRKSNSNDLFTEFTSRKRCNTVCTQSLDNVRDKINEKSVTRIKSEVSICINKNKNGLGKTNKSYCTTKYGGKKSTKFFTSASASCSKIDDNRKHNFGAPLPSLNNPISMHRSEKICRKLTDYTNNVAEVLKLNKESIMLSKNIKSLPNIIVTNKKLLSNSKIYGEFNRNSNCNKLNEKKNINNNLNYNILTTPNIFSTVKQKHDIRIPIDYSFDRIKNINEPKSKCSKSFTYNFDVNYTKTKDSLGMFNCNYRNTNVSEYSKKKANTLFKSVKESFKQKERNENCIDKLLKNKNLKSLLIKPKRTKINKKRLSNLIFNEIKDKSNIQNKITEKKQNDVLKCNDFSKIYGKFEKVVQPNKSKFDDLYFWHNNNIILKQSNEFLYKSDKNIFMNYQTRSLKTSVIGFNCANSSEKALKPHESIEKEIDGNQTCNIAKQGNYKLNNILPVNNYSLASSKNNYLTNNLFDDTKCGFNYTKKNQQKNVLKSIYKKNSKSIYDGFTKVMMDKVHLCIKSLKNKDCKQNTIYGSKSDFFTPSMTLISKDQNWLDYYQSNDEKKSVRNLNERKPLNIDFKKDYQFNKSLLEMTSSKKINNGEDSLEKTKLIKSKINKLKSNKLGDKKDQKFNKVELRKPAVVRIQVKGYELPKVHPSLNIANNFHDYDFNKKALDNKSVIPNVMIRTDSVKAIHSIASYSKRKTNATEYIKNKHHKTHNTLSCLSNDNKIENHENKNQVQEFNNERKTINTELTELFTKKATEKIIKSKIDTAVAWEHDKIYKKDENIPFNFKGELIIKQHASCDDKTNLNSIQYINHKTIRKTQLVKKNLIESNLAVPWIRNKDDAKSKGINLKSQNINNFTDNDKAIPWVQNSIDYITNKNLTITNNMVQNSQINQCIQLSVQLDSQVQKKEEKLVNIETVTSLIKNLGEEKLETITKTANIPEGHKNENLSLNPDNFEKEQMRSKNNESFTSEDKIASENMKNKKISPTNNGQSFVAQKQTDSSKENKSCNFNENVINQIDKTRYMKLLYQNSINEGLNYKLINDGLNYKLINDQLLLSESQNEDVSVNEPCIFDTIKQRELNGKCKFSRANANQCNVKKQTTNISNEENGNSSSVSIKGIGKEYENLNSLNKIKESEFEKCDPQNIDILSKKDKILLGSEENELEILRKDNYSLISKETKIDENYLCKSNDQVVDEIDNNCEKPLFSPFIMVPPQVGVNKHTITHYYQSKISPSLVQFKEKQDYKTAEGLTELSKFKPWNENADLQTSDEQLLNNNKLKEKSESAINNEVIKKTEGLNSITTVSKVTDVQLNNKINVINNNSMKNTKITCRSFSDKQNYISKTQNDSKTTESKGIFNEVPLHCSDFLVNLCQESDEIKFIQKLPANQSLNKKETDDYKQSENNDNRNNKKKLQPLPDDNYKGFNEVLNKTHKQMKRMYEYEEKGEYEGCNHNRNEQLDRKKNSINNRDPKFSHYDNNILDTKTHGERMAELYEYEATILGIYDHSRPANDYGNNIINSTTVNFNRLQNSFKPIIVPSDYERKNKRLQRKNRKKHLPNIELSNQIEETMKKQTKFEDENHNINFNYKEHKTESKDLVATYLPLFQENEMMACSIPSSLSETEQLIKSQDCKAKKPVKVNDSETVTVEVPLSKQTKTDNMLEQCASVDAQNQIRSSTPNKKVEVSVKEIRNMKCSVLDSEDDLVSGNQKLDKEIEISKNYILKPLNNNRYIVINKADKKLENATKENKSLEDEKAKFFLRNVDEETKSEIDKENFQQSSTKLLSESSGHTSNRTVIKPKSFLEESEKLQSKEVVDTKIQPDELMILQNILSNDSELLGNDSFTVCFPKKQLSSELLTFSNKDSFKQLNNKNNTHTIVKTVLNAIAYTVQKNQKTCELTDKDVINNKRLCNDLCFSLENNSTDNTLDNKIETNNECHSDNVKEDRIIMINEVKFPMINAEKSALLYPKETEIMLNTNIKNKCAYKNMPSVSKILNETLPHSMKDALDKWNCSNETYLSTPQEIEEYHKEQLLNDMEFHDCIRRHILKTPLNLLIEQGNPRLKGSLKSLKHVFPRISNVRGLESPVIHPELPYYGIVDCIACYDGNPVLIEWKRSDQPKSLLDLTYDAPVQLSAYIGAINHDKNYNLPINSGLIIVAHTDGSPADVFHLSNRECKKYWKNWLERIEKYIDSKIKL